MEQNVGVNFISDVSPNDIYNFETTLSSGIKLRFNWFYLSKTELDSCIPQLFLLDSNDCKYLEGLSKENQKDVLLSLAKFAKRYQKKKREKVFYLRTFPISRLEKNCHFFTKDLREMLPLIMKKESAILSGLKLKKWESTLNNAFTIDREQLNVIFSDLGINEGSVTIVTDPTHSINKWYYKAPHYFIPYITDAYENFYSKTHAALLIILHVICGFTFNNKCSCGDANCMDNYRTSVESLLREINDSEFLFIRQNSLGTKLNNLKQHCAFQRQALTISQFNRDLNVNRGPEVSHTDYRKVCSDYQLPHYDENEAPLPEWRARYFWLRGCLETFNSDVKYLKMLQNGFVDNLPEGVVDVFMKRNRLAVEKTSETKIEFPNGKASFMDLFYRKEKMLVKKPTKEGECANCQINIKRKETFESQMLESQKNAKHYEDKMKKANESRQEHMEKRTEAEKKATLYEEKALKTMVVEGRLKERDNEIKQLKKQLSSQNNQSEVIESLRKESEKQKTDLKSLRDTNKILKRENGKHVAETTSLFETVECLQKDLAKMTNKNETLVKENGLLLQKIEDYSQVLEGQKKSNHDLKEAHQLTYTNLENECTRLSLTVEETQTELEATKNQVLDLKIEIDALNAQANLDQHNIKTYKQKVDSLLVEKQLHITQSTREKAEKQIENENLQVVKNALVERIKRLEDLLKEHGIVDSSGGDQGSE